MVRNQGRAGKRVCPIHGTVAGYDMLIHRPEIVQRDDVIELSARIELERTVPGAPERVWFAVQARYAEHVSDRGDPFVPVALPIALALGEDLELRGRVSPRLLDGARAYRAVMHGFWPEQAEREIAVVAERPDEDTSHGDGVVTCFSGGVDSFYTLWRHLPDSEPLPPARVTHALMINGFDHDVDLEGEGYFQRVFEVYRPMLERLGVEPLWVRTNQQQLRRAVLRGRMVRSHGAALTSCALVLSRLFRRVYLSSGLDYTGLRPEGSHPLLDHHLSTEATEVFHRGVERSRAEKIEILADWPETWERLRVCFGGQRCVDATGRVGNCGRCDKCVRTMLTLDLIGALDRYTTFPRTLSRAAVRGARFRSNAYLSTRGAIALAKRVGRRDTLSDLRWALAKNQLLNRAAALRGRLASLLTRGRARLGSR